MSARASSGDHVPVAKPVMKKRKKEQVPLKELLTQDAVDEEKKQRRGTRKQQNELLEEIENSKALLDDFNSNKLRALREQNNKVFNGGDGSGAGVMHTREGFMDGQICGELAFAVLRRADKLDDLTHRIHFEDLSQSLAKTFRVDGKFSWRSLGQDVGKLFMRPTPLVSMLGSLDKPEKVRVAAKQRQAREQKGPEVRPETIIQEAKIGADGKEITDEEYSEATFARIKVLSDLLSKDTGEHKAVNLLSFLIDENDHVQTVENFFDLAFLIKSCTAEAIDDPITHQPMLHEKKFLNDNTRDSKQIVLSLNMKDIKKMAATLKKQHSRCPLHRKDELYDAEDATEQAEILQRQFSEKLAESQAIVAERKTQSKAIKSQKTQGK